MTVTLTMTAAQRKQLHSHLFPGDGCEAVAILLCGGRAGERVHRLLVRKVVPVPYGDCPIRRPDLVQWSTDLLPPILEEANREGWSVVKIHGHANDYRAFSPVDDDSDKELFPSVAGWSDADVPHGSVVLLEDGHLFGRTVSPDGVFSPLERITVVGDDVQIDFDNGGAVLPLEAFTDRHARAFGAATTRLLRRLTVAVVGVSGTGSPLIEMLFRLGVGRLLLIEPDFVNEENLNRIVYATRADIGRLKVNVIGDAIERAGLGTEVVRISKYVSNRDVVEAIAEADFIFGCMDGAEGRNVLNRLATCYLLPYIDVGVKLLADGRGTIDEVSTASHYLQPGLSSLGTRGVFTPDEVLADSMRRTNPEEYARRRRERYVVGVDETRPAVISVNFFAASVAVNDFLARLNDYRSDGNAPYAELRASLSHMTFYPEAEKGPSPLAKYIGIGDIEPRLDMPELSRSR
jgi:hypothetical protein